MLFKLNESFYFWFQVQQVQQNAVFHRPSATEK